VLQQAVALHRESLPVGVDEGPGAQALCNGHRVSRAATVDDDHLLGKRGAAQATPDLVRLVLGQHGDGEGRR